MSTEKTLQAPQKNTELKKNFDMCDYSELYNEPQSLNDLNFAGILGLLEGRR